MPKEIKLFTLAKKLNVGIASFRTSLEKRNVPGADNINPNSRVPVDIALQLIQEHGKGMNKTQIDELITELQGGAPKAEPVAAPLRPSSLPLQPRKRRPSPLPSLAADRASRSSVSWLPTAPSRSPSPQLLRPR